MGSQRKMSSAPLLAPQAMACALTNDTKPAESWYSIKALSEALPRFCCTTRSALGASPPSSLPES